MMIIHTIIGMAAIALTFNLALVISGLECFSTTYLW